MVVLGGTWCALGTELAASTGGGVVFRSSERVIWLRLARYWSCLSLDVIARSPLILLPPAAETAHTMWDAMADEYVKRLRQITKRIQDSRNSNDNLAVKKAVQARDATRLAMRRHHSHSRQLPDTSAAHLCSWLHCPGPMQSPALLGFVSTVLSIPLGIHTRRRWSAGASTHLQSICRCTPSQEYDEVLEMYDSRTMYNASHSFCPHPRSTTRCWRCTSPY